METNWDEIAHAMILTLGTLEQLGQDNTTEIPAGVQELIDSIKKELDANWLKRPSGNWGSFYCEGVDNSTRQAYCLFCKGNNDGRQEDEREAGSQDQSQNR